jgi:hypothetical protein
MYAWLWHRLPGRTPARAGVTALIILVVAAALWFYVFPEPRCTCRSTPPASLVEV